MRTIQSELERLKLSQSIKPKHGTKHKRIMEKYNEYIERRNNNFKYLSRFRISIDTVNGSEIQYLKES